MHEIKLDEALRKGKSSVLRDLLDNEAVIKDTGRYSNPPPRPHPGTDTEPTLPAQTGGSPRFVPSWSSQLLLPSLTSAFSQGRSLI